MDFNQPASTPSGTLSPPARQICDTFADLLAGYTGLSGCCEAGLKFLLEAVDRSGGLLYVSSGEEDPPLLIVQRGLSEIWGSQIADPASQLRRLARQILIQGADTAGGSSPANKIEIDSLAGALPIPTRIDIQGALVLQGAPLPPEQLGLLAELALILGRAIRVLRSTSDQQMRLHKAAALQSDLAELAFKADMEGLEKRLIQGTGQVLQSEATILVLADEDNPGFLVYKSLDSEAKWALHLQPDEGKGPVSKCLQTGKIICLEGAQAQIRFDPTCTSDSLLQARSLLCAPLQAGGGVFGALVALNKQGGGYAETDRQMIASIAGLAAWGIQAGRLIQQQRVSRASLEANRWELMSSHNFLRALFDHLPANLYIIDQDYNLLAVNKSRLQQTEKPESEPAGQMCFRMFFGRAEPCPDCRVRETLFAGQISQRSERRRTAKDEFSEWEISSYPIQDDQGRVAQAILLEMDVTEKRRLEAVLTQSEKLAAVGQLAAGVAHEINNPLTAIIANAQILHREIPLDSDLQESVDLIMRAGARAAQVVRNLLDFARKEEYRLRPTDLNETLELATELVRHELLARSVILEMDLDPDLPQILASSDHLQSVWLNLLLNAIDSLDKSPPKIGIASRKLNNELLISISDNGKGIPPENISRIFEPFYTTKAPGRGTGLGLSVSHRIVKQHSGYFRVDSRIGEGSTFTVVLPVN